uniref:Uncharacterized protein n=1 Tax=Timema poppense TaxID=170557 RepID=A0A7R9DHV5_TIMPO|nr:unnamed protein product [Timema poppensis]
MLGGQRKGFQSCVRALFVTVLVTQLLSTDVSGEILNYATTNVNYQPVTPRSANDKGAESNPVPGEIMKKVMSKGCSHMYSWTCLKLDVVSLVDRLSESDKYQVLPGVVVVRDNSTGAGGEALRKFPVDLVASLAKDFPNDVDARVDAFLVRRVGHYLDTHAVNVKLFDPDVLTSWGIIGNQESETSNLQSARRKSGKGGANQMMMAGLGMMGVTMGGAALGALGLLAGKALMTGLLALMLSAIVGLKSLAGGGSKSVTYEVISKPIVSHMSTHSQEVLHEGHHGGGGGGGGGGYGGHSSYGRSFDTAPGTVEFKDEVEGGREELQEAYRGYVPSKQNDLDTNSQFQPVVRTSPPPAVVHPVYRDPYQTDPEVTQSDISYQASPVSTLGLEEGYQSRPVQRVSLGGHGTPRQNYEYSASAQINPQLTIVDSASVS